MDSFDKLHVLSRQQRILITRTITILILFMHALPRMRVKTLWMMWCYSKFFVCYEERKYFVQAFESLLSWGPLTDEQVWIPLQKHPRAMIETMKLMMDRINNLEVESSDTGMAVDSLNEDVEELQQELEAERLLVNELNGIVEDLQAELDHLNQQGDK